MKKIYIVDNWRRMKRTMIIFLSIILIVCLGISSYLGIGFAKISMEKTGDYYYTEQKFHHFEIRYNYGITEQDIKTLASLPNVTKVEGVSRTTGFLQLDQARRLVTVESHTQEIDIANVLEGRLPKKQNEIAIEKVMADEDGILIGSRVILNCEDEDGTSMLLESEFEVVGIVEHPAYSCNYVYSRRGVSEKGNGNCLNFFLVDETAFTENAIKGGYQSAVIWYDDLAEYNCFSKEYSQRSDEHKQEIKKIASTQSDIRYMEIKKEFEQQVEEKKKELDEIKAYLVSSDQQTEELNNSTQEIEEKIQVAQEDFNKLAMIDWNIYDRNSNVSYAMYKENADGLGKLSFSFAFVFIVVAMMVCYSSIGRMITKQKNLIGTQKALGFRPIEIYAQYISYAWVATFWGCVNGILWAVFFVQKLSLKSYKPIYYFKDYFTVCDVRLTVIVVLSTFALTFIASIIACKKVINRSTVALLKDEVIVEGKEFFFEKWFLWRKIPLFNRTILKNLFHEKRHMITTIISVAGCTALVLIGYTLKYAMNDVKIEQFEKIQQFDISLQAKPESMETFSKELDQFENVEKIEFMDQMIGIRLNGKEDIVADLLCTDAEKMNDFFLLEDDETGETVINQSNGVYLSANTASYYQVKIGDEIDILKMNGEQVTVPVIGILKNYVCHFIVMLPSYYEEVMGDPVENNLFFVKLHGRNIEEVRQAFETKDGFLSISGKEMGISIFDNIVASLNSVVQVMISLSTIMAFIVVLNLIVMYINEKSKVLAVMRINGFSIRETKAFVTFSNVVLTILGLCVGVILGIIIGEQIISIIENNSVSYIHTPNVKACLISCGICIGYVIVIGMIGNRKINKLQLNNLNRYD